ncbi:MAG: hypothetical protein ACI4R8_00770 [Candidatus Caccovivens sp.]
MAVKKISSKTSKKAKANSTNAGKVAAVVTTATAVGVAKKAGAKGFLIAIVFLLIGLFVGAGTWFLICRNDTFEIVGNDNLTLTLEETYSDEGVKIIAFGKDDSENYEIETNLLVNEDGDFYSEEIGTFYIKYKSKNLKYSTVFTVEKVRLITFVEASEGGE